MMRRSDPNCEKIQFFTVGLKFACVYCVYPILTVRIYLKTFVVAEKLAYSYSK